MSESMQLRFNNDQVKRLSMFAAIVQDDPKYSEAATLILGAELREMLVGVVDWAIAPGLV